MIGNKLFDTNNRKIVVLTGAGISAESGLKTFRDNNGLWENHSVQEVATPEAFQLNPELVYRFYNERRMQLQSQDVKPNLAHIALAKLETAFGAENVLIVTQNVDNLHEQAGTRNLIHMHGELLFARCTVSQKRFSMLDSFDQSSLCNCCQPAMHIRPDIVWFGEMPLFMDEIYQAISNADLFISIGTSGNVYPAAGFVQEASLNGAQTIELNLEPSQSHSNFDEARYGLASELVPRFVEELLYKC